MTPVERELAARVQTIMEATRHELETGAAEVELRKWCVQEAVKAFGNAGGGATLPAVVEYIYAFVHAPLDRIAQKKEAEGPP